MESNPCSPSSRTDGKAIERNRRRNHMKSLYSELNSLVRPHDSPRDSVALPDQLDEAANYIKRLQERLEKMKERKDSLMGSARSNVSSTASSKGRGGAAAAAAMAGLKPLEIEVQEKGSALEVVLITGLDFQFMFNETIRVLHEEGAETVHASFSVVDDTVFHTIHARVEEAAMGDGAAARISERLKKFVSN